MIEWLKSVLAKLLTKYFSNAKASTSQENKKGNSYNVTTRDQNVVGGQSDTNRYESVNRVLLALRMTPRELADLMVARGEIQHTKDASIPYLWSGNSKRTKNWTLLSKVVQ